MEYNQPIVDNAKIMAKGQVTIPKDIREKMKLEEGDRVTFVWQGEYAIVMNSALYAIKTLQKELAGKFEGVGLNSEEDIMELVRKVRKEMEGR